MKTLVVEDDFVNRILLTELLKGYGQLDVAINGREAVMAVERALCESSPYDLICLDIMMPDMDGHQALKAIRATEEKRGILSTGGAKIIMTTALDDPGNVMAAYRELCDCYLVKPLRKDSLIAELRKFRLI